MSTIAEPSAIVASPFADGSIPSDLQAQVVHIRTCLTTWLKAMEDCRKKVPGSAERLDVAMKSLVDLEVDAPYAFTPAPPYKFRRVLLSCTKCFWIALVLSLTPDEKKEMEQRLALVPPFGARVPQFDGQKCIQEPGSLNEREYEGLMRTVHLVAIGMVPKEVGKIWREIGEVGVQTWEEED
ncbi:hypothetical protein BDQ12DRAFT_717608 [Crucibulum laeve]|uniref:Uncharacterized protein n=1 Tax=Crucibulum laeve TaxID=68775 RepID=A0A5C3MHR2_9AGAR|nr:hypothetical protein BDQ12DRAFT_717608 [Crucibulum laeve]